MIVEPEFHYDKVRQLNASNSDNSISLERNYMQQSLSPDAAKTLANRMIHKVAGHAENLSNNMIMLTNANEILTKDGIHGKIAPVGQGFGTGRHTANKRYRK